MTNFFYFILKFFNTFYELEMKICAKVAGRLNSMVEFKRLMEKMKKRFWTFWRSKKSTDIWRSGGFGKVLKWKIYYFVGISAQALTLGVFFFKQYASGLGSASLQRILRLSFSYETDFWTNSFVAQKSSEMSTLSSETF